MVSVKYHRFPILKNLGEVKIFIVLATTIWIAHFWHSASFGLYEDDFTRIPRAMGITRAELWDYLLNLFLHFGKTEGRPLHPGSIYLFSFLGAKLGGLDVVYWIGYVIVTVNAFLFYTLLKRLFAQQVFAVTGALAFCLFPVYLTRVWLTHSLGHQPSLMFLLLAFHCYLSGRKKLSYLVILGSLLCYETVFPIFLAAPLLRQKWDSRRMGELFVHAVVLAAMVAFIAIARKLTGEGRIANLDLLSTITLAVQHMLEGPLVSIRTLWNRPFETWQNLNGEMVVLMSVGFVGIVWALSGLKPNTSYDNYLFESNFFKQLAKLALLGLMMLALAYPLTLTVPVSITLGGESRIHLGAAVGGSILCGCICSAILFVAIAYRMKRLATAVLAAFFSLLIGFGISVQQGYAVMWQYQQAFWTDVVSLCPDLSEGTVILVDNLGNLKSPEYISQENWTGTIILNQIYQFPKDWSIRPILHKLRSHWQKRIVSDDNLFQLNQLKGLVVEDIERDRQLESSRIILLEARDGKLTRRTEPLRIGSQEFRFKEKSVSGLPPFKKGILYDYLIISSKEEVIRYID